MNLIEREREQETERARDRENERERDGSGGAGGVRLKEGGKGFGIKEACLHVRNVGVCMCLFL